MKKTVCGLLLACLLAFSAGCGQQAAGGGAAGDTANGDGQVYTLKVGTALTETDPIYQGLQSFQKAVEERTNGKVKIEIYGSGSLGEDKDIIEQAKVGANVAVLVDSGRLAEMVPQMGILTAPYIVDSYAEARQVVMSDLFKGWEAELQKNHGVQVLSFNWYQGDRHILTNKPILKPEDLQGVRLRTPGAPIWLETIKALGASPTGMAWSEVYPAIQQGVIDGAEAQHPATYGAKLYEVIKHISKTKHFQLLTGIIASDKWMTQLPEEYQKIVKEEALKAGDEASKKTEESLNDFEQKMIEQGVEVHEVDVNLFKAKTEVVYDKFEGYRELREQINKILGK
ncbi:C4-dicarboxylate TRAP transporter substrate-binding protein [Brevibacillus fulvus]|uniref:Tripartite ATP-independent transporter DctP family solute receptor n=1 Tax=Brevibacillus fulvus TaxID=1125967 RepID=A0A938XXQ1_9BACL|nr:C4-dicarboxylate TRAP transporter substrate-binding protein [Brevibacillus fulvus]MBM7589625.1 tripartite ATP-independent transporter DctP family solute receptor [Brevibacillus fulvus]